MLGAGAGLYGADAGAPGADAGAAEAGATEADAAGAAPGVPGAEAGERHAGFVSEVDGVRGFADDAILAFDRVSGLAAAELANPGLAKPAPVSSRARAAAASADVLSGSGVPLSGVPGPSNVADRGATTASGAPAPSGFAGTSGRPLRGAASVADGAAAFGVVTSERLLPGAFAKERGLTEFAPAAFSSDSASGAVDFRTVSSSSVAASAAFSARCAAGSAWLSTRPPVKSLATTLSAASHGWVLTAGSPTIVTPCQTPQLAE